MSVTRVGDWARVARIIRNLKTIIEQSRNVWLIRMAAKGEAIAVTHISAQDLGWTRLKASTIRAKIKKGQSENILVATSTYFQNITSWVQGESAYVGVKRGVQEADGTDVSKLAAWLEYGTQHIPKRPLWQPTFKELNEWQWQHNNFRDIVLNKLRQM